MQGSLKRAQASHKPGFSHRMSSNVEFFASKASKTQLEILESSKNDTGSFSFRGYAGEHEKWSWRSLKEEFRVKDSNRLFDKYQARIQHKFFLMLLTLDIVFNIVAIIVYFIDATNKSLFPGPAFMRIASLIVFILFFVLACSDEHLLRPTFSRTIAAATILTAMIFSEHGAALFALTGDIKTYLLQRIRPTFYLITAAHILLPFTSKVHSWIATIVIIATEFMLTFYQRIDMSCSSEYIPRFAIADLFFYSFSSMFGFYMNFLLEIANRKAFMNHRSCVESTFKLDYEQDQQEQLLNTCIPRHLTDTVKNDIRMMVSRIALHERMTPKPFNKLYVEKYKNVSILFADIVNSMALTASLSPNDLVETYNELFGRFDECAEKNQCLRIKLLGDCYYCVSGLPKFDKNHAVNCVKMGLDMINVFKSIQEDRNVDIKMRIGIHSGMVLSGLIGVHKWQYDIWSIDTMIANKMEHEGVPGLVHITQKTLDLIPEEKKRDFIIKKKVDDDGEVSYLVSKKEIQHTRNYSGSPASKRKKQTEALKAHINKLRRRSSFEPIQLSRRRTVLESGLRKFREMVKTVNNCMDKAIDEMPLSIKSQWTNSQGIHSFFFYFISSTITSNQRPLFNGVKFSTWEFEKQFAKQPDPLFSFYLFCSGALCITMLAIKFLIPQMTQDYTQKTGFVVTLAIICISLIYTYYKEHSIPCLLRIIIWFVISSSLMACSMVDLIVPETNSRELSGEELFKCAFQWYHTICIILAMSGVSLFIRINLWLKFALHLIGVITFIILSTHSCSVYGVLVDQSQKDHVWLGSVGFNPRIGHIYYVVMVAVLLNFVDRQLEYIFRLDFQWTNRLEGERIEVQTMGEINRILLENILPVHVAQRYLYNSSVSADQLYHETYDCCAVMFASIPNYSEFYSENNLNEEGLKCLQLLNEIICEFDQLLSHINFQKIEKIKTIGSTYMAASGLLPGRGSTDVMTMPLKGEDATTNVIILVRFATALMETLQKINKDALQDFKLRIGIAVGPVIAGVVGAAKPQYDIWGDTVNVASRMESTGLAGRVQVTSETAEVLLADKNHEFQVQRRGFVMVKGKGELITYLINTQFDNDDGSD